MTSGIFFSKMHPSLRFNNSRNTEQGSTKDTTSKDEDEDDANNTISMDVSASSSSSRFDLSFSNRSGRRRLSRVCFTRMDIYTFEQILGDNPAVCDGPPLALAPQHTTHTNMDIEYFEYKRKPRRANRRDLIDSKHIREEYLKSQGYSRTEIQQATSEASAIRRKRERTLPKKWDKFHLAIENSRKLLRGRKPANESATVLLQRHQEATRAA